MVSIAKLYESSVIRADSIVDLGVLIDSKLQFHHQVNYDVIYVGINPLNTKLNPICHFLAILGVHPIFHVIRIRVKVLG
jgi:hypothetical protein